MTSISRARTAAVWALWALLAVTVVGQLWGLYSSRPDNGPGIPHLDKLAHFTIFFAPALVGGLLGLRRWWPALLAVHAPVSELVQAGFLPTRSGDPFDALADLGGIALALWLVALWRRRRVVSEHDRRWYDGSFVRHARAPQRPVGPPGR